MLTKEQKNKIIEKFKTHAHDTGSSEVQIALLTAEMQDLSEHLKRHKKDHSSRRGLIKKVNERKRLLRYLERENLESFLDIVKKLKIKIKRKEIEPEREPTQEELEKIEEEEVIIA